MRFTVGIDDDDDELPRIKRALARWLREHRRSLAAHRLRVALADEGVEIDEALAGQGATEDGRSHRR